MTRITHAITPQQPRDYHGVNWEGLSTLYRREVLRFWKVAFQTLLSPVVITLLYMMVFVVAMRGARPAVDGVSFAQFVGPGLIMMSILNNAFANSSSSLVQAKLMGTAVDFLTPPLSPAELSVGFTAGAVTRGLLVGLVTTITVWPFSRFGIVHPWAILYFSVMSSIVLALVGVVTGLWAEKFDHLASVTNFIVTPMTFLSGTFYRVTNLPAPFGALSKFNPFFYMIDGFRYGFIGRSDGSVLVGVFYTLGLAIVLAVAVLQIFRTGWRLKS
ncbi:ABC transporter permease [Caulobacter sp. S45]|uniref:ABC transporter permease n=1 Tax=Caulobacter sp. S45 TaxID=1641861 RepID=UPI0035302528